MTIRTNYLFAAPPLPPPNKYQPWRRAKIEWIGWDGSVWDLSDWRTGVFITQDGVEGFSKPAHTDWVAPRSPAMHGQEFTGFIVEPRKVFLPLYLYSDGGSGSFQERDTAFWATMKADKYGTLRYTSTAGTRELRCRFQDDGGHAYVRDPHYFGWTKYGVALVADDPFWMGAEVTRSWDQPEKKQFFGGVPNGKAPLFFIGSGSQLGTAKMSNPGDVDAWPIWVVTGPAKNINLGVGGRFVSAPFDVFEGSTLTINTDPTDQTAWLDSDDVTDELGDYSFAAIPSGSDLPLELSMAGTGSVAASFVPRFDRAW
ncbi:hypothetical protein ACTXI0_04540 [Arthrobacter rhombi]|uniref:hypothetical protein n=1 Tax=Arthrobacter rhombi TaxID=71253 RepID=UPI003FD4A271